MTAQITFEEMNHHFLKVHLGHGMVLHRFRSADGPDADPHDHAQWGFRSTVLSGGYVEEVFDVNKPFDPPQIIERRERDAFYVSPYHVHRIVRLLAPETWTLIEPEQHTGEASAFYQFRDGGVWCRHWHETEWMRLS